MRSVEILHSPLIAGCLHLCSNSLLWCGAPSHACKYRFPYRASLCKPCSIQCLLCSALIAYHRLVICSRQSQQSVYFFSAFWTFHIFYPFWCDCHTNGLCGMHPCSNFHGCSYCTSPLVSFLYNLGILWFSNPPSKQTFFSNNLLAFFCKCNFSASHHL